MAPIPEKELNETVKVFCRLRPSVAGAGKGLTASTSAAAAAVNGCTLLTQLGADDAQQQEDGFTIIGNADDNTVCYNRRGGGYDAEAASSSCPRNISSPRSGANGANTSIKLKLTGFLPDNCTQSQVYEKVALNVVEGVLQGYNGTIFAYGQTGSGKTHTMWGKMGELSSGAGIIPRCLDHLLNALAMQENCVATVTISYLQIYCEMLSDLLQPDNDGLSIREKPNGEVYVEGLSQAPVETLEQAIQILLRGDANRATAATNLNAHSSRSHAAVLVKVERKVTVSKLAKTTVIKSMLVLVDLAGSERAKQSGAVNQRFEELKAINLSLSALGNCVSALSKAAGKKKKNHVPYRDSKLTRLLQQSLGGNARTSLIVNIPPGDEGDKGETFSTLKFAQRALSVPVCAQVYVEADYEGLYNSLQSQLDVRTDEISTLALENARLRQRLELLETQCYDYEASAKTLHLQLDNERTGFTATLKALDFFDDDGNSGSGSSRSGAGGSSKQAAGEGAGGGGGGGGGDDIASQGGGAVRRGSANAAAAAAAMEAMTEMMKKEIQLLREEHAREIVELKRRNDERVNAYKIAAETANDDWNSMQYKLQKEREEHLVTLKEYKENTKRLRQSEVEMDKRIAEIHAEIAEKGSEVEALQEAYAMQNETIASQHRQLDLKNTEQRGGGRDYVHRSTVEEMKKLFEETVAVLAARVEHLESSAPREFSSPGSPPPAPRAAAMSSEAVQRGSEALLKRLSGITASTPGTAAGTGGKARGAAGASSSSRSSLTSLHQPSSSIGSPSAGSSHNIVDRLSSTPPSSPGGNRSVSNTTSSRATTPTTTPTAAAAVASTSSTAHTAANVKSRADSGSFSSASSSPSSAHLAAIKRKPSSSSSVGRFK